MKIYTIVVFIAALGVVHAATAEIQKIIAYKTSKFEPRSAYSTIQIVQNGAVVSAAKFKNNTKGAKFKKGLGSKEKSLFFDKQGRDITIQFCHTANTYFETSGPLENICAPDVFPISSVPINPATIPAGSRIEIKWNGRGSDPRYTIAIK